MYGDQENLTFKILEKNKKDEEKYFFLFEKPLLTFFSIITDGIVHYDTSEREIKN